MLARTAARITTTSARFGGGLQPREMDNSLALCSNLFAPQCDKHPTFVQPLFASSDRQKPTQLTESKQSTGA